MLARLRFALVNLGVAGLLVAQLSPYLHYPADLPLRIQPGLPGLLVALFFSLLTPLSLGWVPGPRWVRALLTGLTALISLALAGASWAYYSGFLTPQEGAQIACLLLWNSPGIALPALLWALWWSDWNFPATPSVLTHEEKQGPSDWEEALIQPAADWRGSSR